MLPSFTHNKPSEEGKSRGQEATDWNKLNDILRVSGVIRAERWVGNMIDWLNIELLYGGEVLCLGTY